MAKLTYKKSTSLTPAYGEYGANVKTLQQQLNKANAGKDGYTALKEDGYYGPLTQQASNYKSPTTETAPTMDKIFNYEPTVDDSFMDKYGKDSRDDAEMNVDPDEIRKSTLKSFGDRFSSINQIYDDMLRKVTARNKLEGAGRIGQGTAIIARRGLGGSVRGMGMSGAIEETNRDIQREDENLIENQRYNAIQGIMTQASARADAEIAQRREAKSQGAKNYVEFLKGQEERKTKNVNGAISALITQGIDPLTMDVATLDELSKKLKTTNKDLIGKYTESKTAFDTANAEKEAENALKSQFNLSEGQARYGKDKDGNVVVLASRAKTYAPKAGTGSSIGGGTGAISDTAQNIIDQMNINGGTVDDYVKGSSKDAQALRNEVYRGLNMKGGRTEQSNNLIKEGFDIVKKMLDVKDYNRLGGISPAFGSKLSIGGRYGNATARASQLSAILSRENLGLLKGAMSDKDLSFIQSMSTGFKGEGYPSEIYIKDRLESIYEKLNKKLAQIPESTEGGGDDVEYTDEQADMEVQDLIDQGYSEEQIQELINA